MRVAPIPAGFIDMVVFIVGATTAMVKSKYHKHVLKNLTQIGVTSAPVEVITVVLPAVFIIMVSCSAGGETIVVNSIYHHKPMVNLIQTGLL